MNHLRRISSLVVVIAMLGVFFSIFSTEAQDAPEVPNVDVEINPLFGLCSISPDYQVATDAETTGTGWADAVTTGTGFADAVTTGTGWADAVTTGTAFDLRLFLNEEEIRAFSEDIIANERDFSWVTDYVATLQASPLFNTEEVAILVLDNQGHGEGVLQTIEASLLAMGAPNNLRFELVDIGAENGAYRADEIATLLSQRVEALQEEGINFFVVNMSFALVPCVAEVTFTDTDETFTFDYEAFVDLLIEQHTLAAEPDPSLVKPVDACYIRDVSEERQYITIHFTYENPNPVPVEIPPSEGNNVLTLLSEGDINYRTDFETKKVPYQFFKSAEAPYHGFDIALEVDDGASWQLEWELNGEAITADSTLSDFDPENDVLPECEFSYATDTDLYLSDGSDEGAPIGACVREINGTYVAFIDVFNPSEEAVVLWPFSSAYLYVAYGGYDYFGVEALPVTVPPGLSAYPHNAIQIPIINPEDSPLEVYFSNSSTEFSDFISVDIDLDTNACPDPQYLEWRYSIVDYLINVLGVPEERVDEFIVALFTEVTGLDPNDTPFTGLDDLLRDYLAQSADAGNPLQLAPVAASGNFAQWFADFFGLDADEIPPLAPAFWRSTIASAGTFGEGDPPWGYTTPTGQPLQFTHIGDVAAPVGSYCFGTIGCGAELDRPLEAINAEDWQRYLLGTSYSAPGVSAVLAGYLSTGTCTFPIVDSEARPPLIVLDTLPSTPLLPGNEVFTCSLEAPETGTVTISKGIFDGEEIAFDFTGDLGDFTLEPSNTYSQTFTVPAGSYAVTELLDEANWELLGMSCLPVNDENGDPNGVADFDTNTLTIDLDAGEELECSFTNAERRASLTITKETTPDGDTTPFEFNGPQGEAFMLMDGQSMTFALVLRQYTITEENIPAGWSLDSVQCENAGFQQDVLDPVTSELIGVEVTVGTTPVECVFSNVQEATENLPPTIEAIPDQYNMVGDSASLQVMANDPEGLALRYEATGLPTGASINVVTGLISGTLGEAGVFNVTASVIDSEGQTASTNFTWTVEEDDDTTVTPTTPAPTTPAPSGIVALEVCWVEDQNNATTVWRVTNPNNVPLEPGTPLKAIFDWQTFDMDGNPLQSAERWDQTGEVNINTNLSYAIEVTWFLFNNAVSDPMGTVRAEATEAYRCQDDSAPEMTEQPETTEEAGQPEVTEQPEEPESTQQPEMTEQPQEPEQPEPSDTPSPAPQTAQALAVCWVENQNGATTVWRITNPNSVPLQPGTQQKLVFNWTAMDETSAVIQSAQNWDQTGSITLNTPLAASLQVDWSLFDNGPLQPLGTTTAFATEAYRCE